MEKLEYEFRNSQKGIIVLVIKKKVLFPVLSLIFVLGAIPLITGVKVMAEEQSYRIACHSFPSKDAAQKAFDQNPVKYKALDRDGDKKVCE